MSNKKLKPCYINVEGVLVPGVFKPEHVREVMNYKPVQDDLFVATYPKCGTTWMLSVVTYILRKGKELDDPMAHRSQCPFIDATGLKDIQKTPRPIFKTHLPFTHVPYSPEAKYIYVLRNPKDCCVSMYYHTKRIPFHRFGEATFSDFFELFMNGEVEYNDYFDHLTSWYPHIHDKNVFFTTYEDMKKDLPGVVLKLASFLGQEYIDAIQNDSSVLQNILRFSGFDYMKNNTGDLFRVAPKFDSNDVREEEREIKPPKEEKGDKTDFLRKGIIGDWMNHFSEEENDRMNKKFVERTKGTEIFDLYKSYMGL